MKDLVIVGAGSRAREIIYMVEQINRVCPTWRIRGLLCDDLHAMDTIPCRYKIISTITDYMPSDNEWLALAIAMPRTKKTVVESLLKRGCKFATLIHPNTKIDEYTHIGVGSTVSTFGEVGFNSYIGDYVSIMGSMIGSDTYIDDYSTTTGFSNIAGAHIGKSVFIGSHAVILNNVHVGDDCVIGAGCIISKDMKDSKTAFCERPKIVDNLD